MSKETYLTEYRDNGRLYGGRVKAGSWAGAQAKTRTWLGEKVIGVLTGEGVLAED